MQTKLLGMTVLAVLMACQPSLPEPLVPLAAQSCVPYASVAQPPVLPEVWRPYLSATRLCPLRRQAGDNPAIVLVSVFIEAYYRGKPENAPWENFPKPLLLDRHGQAVGELAELFPEQSPGQLLVHYGRWQGDLPTVITQHIVTPALGGDQGLPKLVWDPEQQRYRREPDAAQQ